MYKVCWVTTDPYERSKILSRERNLKGKQFRVYVCPKCKRAHETIYSDGEGIKTNFYNDFPTYGLERIHCKNCNG